MYQDNGISSTLSCFQDKTKRFICLRDQMNKKFLFKMYFIQHYKDYTLLICNKLENLEDMESKKMQTNSSQISFLSPSKYLSALLGL